MSNQETYKPNDTTAPTNIATFTVRQRVGRPSDLEDTADTTAQTTTVKSFEDVINIRHERKYDSDEWPTITVTQSNGNKIAIENATVDVAHTTPELDVTMIHDTTASLEYQRVTTFECYGIWRSSHTDKHGNTHYATTLFIQDDDGPRVLSPHGYRGFVVKYPDGSTEHKSSVARHSRTARKHFDTATAYTPPYATSEGTLKIETPDGIFHNVTNVERVDDGQTREFDLHIGPNTVRVDEITDAHGPCYTVCAKHEPSGHGTATITSIQRAIGLYVNDHFATGTQYLSAVGFPKSASIYKTPVQHNIAPLDALKKLRIKLPDGTIQNPDVQAFTST